MTKTETEILSFTREEFYEYVWTAPATKLAKELGCSDVMIGKVCKSYDIPKPYSGYWALLAHGKESEKTPLPASGNDSRQHKLTFRKHPECKTTVDEPPPEERQELIHEAREELLAKQEKEKARIEDLMLRAHHWKESQSLVFDVCTN